MVTAVSQPSHHDSSAPGHAAGHAHGKSPGQRLIDLMRLEWADVYTLLAFALGVGLLTLVAPAAIEALVNTVAFGILLWPVFVLAAVMFTLLFVAAVLRAMQTYVAECLQRRLFVRTALGFADRQQLLAHHGAVCQGTSLVGAGTGQTSRVDAVRIALEKAGERARGSVLASDAFFPFPDSIELIARAGIAAIVQPGARSGIPK